MSTLNRKDLTYAHLAKVIDHSLLRPELTDQDVIDGCLLAARYHTATVCVKPCHVQLAVSLLQATDVKVSTVIGFPHGGHLTAIKMAESRAAVDDGAVEPDMVVNIGALRSNQTEYVREDIQAVCETAHARGAKVKLILENAYLSDEQKILGCQLSEKAGADWVKTSTGFAPSDATLDNLHLMRRHLSPHVQLKAAGGIRTLDAILAVIDAGCTHCGATATASILDEYEMRCKASSLAA